MPWALTGSRWYAASPTRAQPAPNARRTWFGARSIPLTADVRRAARSRRTNAGAARRSCSSKDMARASASGLQTHTQASASLVGKTPAKDRSSVKNSIPDQGRPAKYAYRVAPPRPRSSVSPAPTARATRDGEAVGAHHEPGGDLDRAAVAIVPAHARDPPRVIGPDAGDGDPGGQRGPGRHGGLGQDRVEDVTAWSNEMVHAEPVLYRPGDRPAVGVERHLAQSRGTGSQHRLQQPPAPQRDDAGAGDLVGRIGVARQVRPVQQEHIVAEAGQQHRGRRPGDPGPHHHHVSPDLHEPTLRGRRSVNLGGNLNLAWRSTRTQSTMDR